MLLETEVAVVVRCLLPLATVPFNTSWIITIFHTVTDLYPFIQYYLMYKIFFTLQLFKIRFPQYPIVSHLIDQNWPMRWAIYIPGYEPMGIDVAIPELAKVQL